MKIKSVNVVVSLETTRGDRVYDFDNTFDAAMFLSRVEKAETAQAFGSESAVAPLLGWSRK
jgi:hypothetical protein